MVILFLVSSYFPAYVTSELLKPVNGHLKALELKLCPERNFIFNADVGQLHLVLLRKSFSKNSVAIIGALQVPVPKCGVTLKPFFWIFVRHLKNK